LGQPIAKRKGRCINTGQKKRQQMQPDSNIAQRYAQDPASTLAIAILQMIAQALLATSPDQITLHASITALLRDAIAAIQHQTASEIRLGDE
jgi:hypothetical protein